MSYYRFTILVHIRLLSCYDLLMYPFIFRLHIILLFSVSFHISFILVYVPLRSLFMFPGYPFMLHLMECLRTSNAFHCLFTCFYTLSHGWKNGFVFSETVVHIKLTCFLKFYVSKPMRKQHSHENIHGVYFWVYFWVLFKVYILAYLKHAI